MRYTPVGKRFSRCVATLAAGVLALSMAGPAVAEVDEVSLAQQFGVSYLPLMVMRHNKLIEKHVKEAGLGDIEVTWGIFGGGPSMNSALLSGNLDFGSGGVGPLLKIWDKTQDIYDVHAVAALNTMPLFLNTNDPEIQSLEDFGEGDRIALPAVKVSIQAITLQMAVAEKFGMENYDKLDRLTVSMKHPGGMAALISGGTGINGHLTSPPYQYQELIESDDIHTVFSSYDVLGGPSTFNLLWTTAEFREENPKTYGAVLAALAEAMEFIENNKREAAQIYIDEADSSLSQDLIHEIITKPGVSFTLFPKNMMKYAEFMYKTGSIETMPESVKTLFFPEVFKYQEQ